MALRRWAVVLAAGAGLWAPGWTAWAAPARAGSDANFEVGKVVEYVNDPDITRDSVDRSLEFEEKFLNYGAITSEQKDAVKGHYIYVQWRAKQPARDLKVRFDYRQKVTKDKVHTLEVKYPEAKGWQRSVFKVVGEAYKKQGLVTCWRVQLLQAGQVVGEKRSFIW